MLIAFLESIRYVGHILPVVFLRVFLGYYYLIEAWSRFVGDFMLRPRIAEQISELLPASTAPDWYKLFVVTQMVPRWQTLAFVIVALEFAIGISYLVGFVVRPMALLAALLAFNMHYISPAGVDQLMITFVGIHLTLAWIGAGRCVGIDYYYYKRRRGIWW
ncbi:MAG: DoxX family membrane protein [Bdellovibrionaceae bacterium]|nr:DoxX family membrane protein [Pseudobdellovibrionaceae bacterium]